MAMPIRTPFAHVCRNGSLLLRGCPGAWIEYRPKLRVYDAICSDRTIPRMQIRMIEAKRLRTDDLFEAIGFVLRGGQPSKEMK